MPFLGYTHGAGHSVLANRFSYLSACFWSIYAYISHIVVAVNSQADYNYCRFSIQLLLFFFYSCYFYVVNTVRLDMKVHCLSMMFFI